METICVASSARDSKVNVKRIVEILPATDEHADLPSRGVKASELVKSFPRWNGPTFLYHPEVEWPASRNEESNEIALQETVKRPILPTNTLVTKENSTPLIYPSSLTVAISAI